MLQLLNPIFDFFLPRFCPACDSKLKSDESFVCNNCISNIKLADENRLKNEFARKFEGKNIISGFTSLYVFEKDKELQEIIHSFKYSKKFLVGKFLGNQVGKKLLNKIQNWEIDLIVPIPLHHLKKADRGYNQAYYIAKGLGQELTIKVSENAVKRVKYTQSQTTMTLKERQVNMGEAFKLRNKNKILNKNILLVDDVITTGATTAECAKVFLEGGANKVYAASIAIADYDNEITSAPVQ